MHDIHSDKLPILPRPLAFPLSLFPDHLHSALLARTLNTVFSAQVRAGELEFLRSRMLLIRVQDADIEFRLTLVGNEIGVDLSDAHYDLRIIGTVYDFLTLISRREDADTLFFQRRLKMQGDTELGLYVKNFLDGLDVESLGFHKPADFVVQRVVSLYERLFC